MPPVPHGAAARSPGHGSRRVSSHRPSRTGRLGTWSHASISALDVAAARLSTPPVLSSSCDTSRCHRTSCAASSSSLSGRCPSLSSLIGWTEAASGSRATVETRRDAAALMRRFCEVPGHWFVVDERRERLGSRLRSSRRARKELWVAEHGETLTDEVDRRCAHGRRARRSDPRGRSRRGSLSHRGVCHDEPRRSTARRQAISFDDMRDRGPQPTR